MNENKYGSQKDKPGERAHNQSERNADWGNDQRSVNPAEEEKRANDRKESQERKDNQTDADGESTHPDHKEDTQSDQSEDPTRKNEANQGTSDLRTRERTNFRREGE